MNQQACLIPSLRQRGVTGAGMAGTGCFGVPSPRAGIWSHRGAVPTPGAVAGTSLGVEPSVEGGVLITVISRARGTLPIVSEDAGGDWTALSPKPSFPGMAMASSPCPNTFQPRILICYSRVTQSIEDGHLCVYHSQITLPSPSLLQ